MCRCSLSRDPGFRGERHNRIFPVNRRTPLCVGAGLCHEAEEEKRWTVRQSVSDREKDRLTVSHIQTERKERARYNMLMRSEGQRAGGRLTVGSAEHREKQKQGEKRGLHGRKGSLRMHTHMGLGKGRRDREKGMEIDSNGVDIDCRSPESVSLCVRGERKERQTAYACVCVGEGSESRGRHTHGE